MRAAGHTYEIVEGTSEPQDFELLNDGEALVGTGIDVDLVIRAIDPAELPVTLPSVAWLSQVGGTVRVSGVENLEIGTYKVRYELSDSGSDIGFVPNGGEPDTWRVVRA